MPQPDPVPRPPDSASVRRLKRAIRLVALFAATVAALSVAILSRGQDEWRIHMMIATFLGVFLTITLAGALMLLAFFSSATGHDSDAANFRSDEDPE